MEENRKQLTLFIEEPSGSIEKIRTEFNPEQSALISTHVTLCREDEIEHLADVIKRIKSIQLPNPVRVEFQEVKRFSNGKGVLIPAADLNIEFIELRKSVLGQEELKKEQLPHITLMHPRNSTCTNEIFKQITERTFPTKLEFSKISLIEQKNGGKWKVLQEFDIVKEVG